jgi:hypothetical protein
MMDDVGQPPNANMLSVDSAKGRLVVERMDSIRNLFGCELRMVDSSGDTGTTTTTTTTTFAVSRLDEYKAPDNQLLDRLKVIITNN